MPVPSFWHAGDIRGLREELRDDRRTPWLTPPLKRPRRTAPDPRTAARRTRKIRTHHLQQMKERGEKWAMLTAYDQYAAATFDEAGIPVHARRRLGLQQRLRQRDVAAGHGRRADPARPRRDPLDEPRAGRRRPAVRLLPALARAGLRHGRAVHEGGQRARGQARGRPADGAAGQAADRRRHPGHGAHRLHAAGRAQPRRLPRAGPRRRRPSSSSPRPRRSRTPGRSRSSWRWCPRRSPPR